MRSRGPRNNETGEHQSQCRNIMETPSSSKDKPDPANKWTYASIPSLPGRATEKKEQLQTAPIRLTPERSTEQRPQDRSKTKQYNDHQQ